MSMYRRIGLHIYAGCCTTSFSTWNVCVCASLKVRLVDQELISMYYYFDHPNLSKLQHYLKLILLELPEVLEFLKTTKKFLNHLLVLLGQQLQLVLDYLEDL